VRNQPPCYRGTRASADTALNETPRLARPCSGRRCPMLFALALPAKSRQSTALRRTLPLMQGGNMHTYPCLTN
jgi:hypothetical protein